MKKVSKRILSALLAAMMVLTIVPVRAAAASEPGTSSSAAALPDSLANGYSSNENAYQIYPVPHSVTYGDETAHLSLPRQVVLVKDDSVDDVTVDYLREVLQKYGISMTVGSAGASGTKILLGNRQSSHLSGYNAPATEGLFSQSDLVVNGKYDPYILTVVPKGNTVDTIAICGLDTTAVYRGVTTLEMMLSSFAGRYLLAVTIEDYANVKYRGIVEGFYGRFDWEERYYEVEHMRLTKGNMYVYAPKGDNWHYGAESYTALYKDHPEELAALQKMLELCEEYKVDFAWSMHLGHSSFFSGVTSKESPAYTSHMDLLKAKLSELYGLGVRNFHFMYDDAGNGSSLIVEFIKDVHAYLKTLGNDCGPIMYCCAGYNVGWATNQYPNERNMLRQFPQDVLLYWTGSEVNTPITQDNINFPKTNMDHYPATWLNYPCNEHARTSLFLGDISYYVKDANKLKDQAAFLSNPQDYAGANQVAFFQLFSWAWNRDDYTTYLKQLWEDSFKYLQPQVWKAYQIIGSNVSNALNSGRVGNNFPESDYLQDKITSVQNKIVNGGTDLYKDAEIKELLAELDKIIWAIGEMRTNCHDTFLMKDLEPWLKSLENVVNGLIHAINAAVALDRGQYDKAIGENSTAVSELAKWNINRNPATAYTKDTDVTTAGSKRLQPMAQAIVAYVSQKLESTLGLDTQAATGERRFIGRLNNQDISGSIGNSNIAKAFDDSDSTYATWESGYQNVKVGDYYGVDLGSVRTVTGIRILQGQNDNDHNRFHNAHIEVSENGEDWVALTSTLDSVVFELSGLSLRARYVRLVLDKVMCGANCSNTTGRTDFWTRIRTFDVTVDEATGLLYTDAKAPNATVTENGSTYTLTVNGSVTLEPGGYIGIQFTDIAAVNAAVAAGLSNGLVIRASHTPVAWSAVTEDGIAAKYVIIRNDGNTSYTGTLPPLTVTLAEPLKEPKLSAYKVAGSSAASQLKGDWGSVFDGDPATSAATSAASKNGDYLIFDLGGAMELSSIALVVPETSGFPADANKLRVYVGNNGSPDSSDWVDYGVVDVSQIDPNYMGYRTSHHSGDATARYIKIESIDSDANVITIHEIVLNGGASASQAGAFSGTPAGNFTAAVDGSLATALSLDVAGPNCYMEYLITGSNNVGNILVMQDATNLCYADVQVQDAKGTWHTLGQLDMTISGFDASQYAPITALRLKWKEGTTPTISEIILKGTDASSSASEPPVLLPSVTSADPSVKNVSISVDYGTLIENVGLPVQGSLTLAGGKIVTAPIRWECANYNDSKSGTYNFTGRYDLSGLNVSDALGVCELTAKVRVKPAASSGEGPSGPTTAPDGDPIELATGAKVYVSGVENNNLDSFGGDYLTDGLDNTRWSSNKIKDSGGTGKPTDKDKAWAYIDLAKGNNLKDTYDDSKDIYITEVKVVGTTQNKAWPTQYAIQVSDDAQNWTTVKEEKYDASESTGTTRTATLDPDQAHGRYLRILVHEMNHYAVNATGVSIDGIYVKGYQGERMAAASIAADGPVAAAEFTTQPVDLIHDGDGRKDSDVYASGIETTAQDPKYNAIDPNNTTSKWSSNHMKTGQHEAANQTHDSWYVVDLGENVQDITKVTMEFFNKVWPDAYLIQVADETFEPHDYTGADVNVGSTINDENAFTGSNEKNAICWKTIYTATSVNKGDYPTYTINKEDFTKPYDTDPVPARYIRIFFDSINAAAVGHCVGLEDLHVEGIREEIEDPDPGPVGPTEPVSVKSVDPLKASGLVGKVAENDLPSKVPVTLSDDTKVALPVTWDLSGANTAGDHTVTGKLDASAITAYPITCDKDAQLTLTLVESYTAEDVLMPLSSRTVWVNTPFEALKLPGTVAVELTTGPAVLAQVTWDNGNYNPAAPGTQTITGTLGAVAGVDMNGLTVSISVNVKSLPGEENIKVNFETYTEQTFDTKVVAYGGTVDLTDCVPARKGYTFTGWAVDEKGVTLWGSGRKAYVSMTLYAQYKQIGTPDPTPGPGTDPGPVVPPTPSTVDTPAAANGSYSVSSRYAGAGKTVTVTPMPNEGYTVGSVTVTDKSGKSVKVTANSDGTYSFVMPAETVQPVTVKVTFKAKGEARPSEKFTDVAQNVWYREYIDYVVENGLMEGVTATTFEPEEELTRAQLVIVLWRLEGKPTVAAASFTDVKAGQWFAAPIAWASANKIVTGYGDGTFGPDDAVTREQAAAILYRYAQYKGYDTTVTGSLAGYTDTGDVDGYAVEAMKWTTGHGIITGVTETTLVPRDTAIRAQVAAILMRFCENIVK